MSEKHGSPLKQLDRVCLFMTMFSLIFTVCHMNVCSFSPSFGLIVMVFSGQPEPEPGTFWIPQIWASSRQDVLLLCVMLNRHSCRKRSLMRGGGAWKTTGMRPPSCPADPFPLPRLPHSDSVTNIQEGRPWRPCKQGRKRRRGQHNPRASVIQGRLTQCPTTQRVILRQLGEY